MVKEKDIIAIIEAKLKYYNELKTYTEYQEYRREGAVGILEDILDLIKS